MRGEQRASTVLRSVLEGQRANIEACVRCGLCLEACPTYRLTNLEEESPRGRIAIAGGLLDGTLPATDDAVEHQLSCLLCDGCTAVCPAGVQMEPLGTAVREAFGASGALPFRTRLLARALRVLGRPPRLARWTRLLALAQRLGVVKAAGRLGVLDRVGVDADALPPPQRPLPIDGSRWEPVGRSSRETVELFAGCVMSTMFADIDVATAEVVAAAGFTVAVTAGQRCCGALSAHEGDLATARSLAEQNIAAFASERRLIVNAAGCGAFLRRYAEIAGSAGERLAGRVVDVSELLSEALPQFKPIDLPGPIAYQDPCHARLAQGIVAEPRTLLRSIPGVTLIEASDPDQCCGSAGVYNVAHPQTSAELARRKAEALIASGARLIVTSNPGCLMQVRAGLRALGAELPVVHLVEVLRRALPDPVNRHPGRAA